MPNGGTIVEYNQAWCDERHRMTDKAIEEQKQRSRRTSEAVELLRDRFETRMDAVERKVAVWGGLVSAALVLIELASKFFK